MYALSNSPQVQATVRLEALRATLSDRPPAGCLEMGYDHCSALSARARSSRSVGEGRGVRKRRSPSVDS